MMNVEKTVCEGIVSDGAIKPGHIMLLCVES
jgi:hypothetical protein